ncbi:uncharacterized protein LOC135138413 [Zophobas morio]|uniref:uncharacterized protein LOC135138413 n=1 Tax=Zophobas morio TaxID=2755281 RepID=UPI003082AD96
MQIIRSTSTSSKSRGGGVLIAVLNTFQSEVIDYDLYSTREEIWVVIYINGSNKMLLGAVYIPPDSNTAVYEEHASFVEHLTSDYNEDIVCIVGDYNLPGLEWCVAPDGDGFVPLGVSKDVEQSVCDGFSYCSLSQLNNIKNDKGTVLDLVFSNWSTTLVQQCEPLINPDVFHPALSIHFDILGDDTLNDPLNICLDFRNAQYDRIIDNLFSYNWSILNEQSCINQTVELFYDFLYRLIDCYVASKLPHKISWPKWISDQSKCLIKQKKFAYKKFKISNLQSDYNIFVNLRKACKKSVLNDRELYIKKVENDVVNDSKSFWHFVNETKNDRHTMPSLLHLEDVQAAEGQDIANLFATFFQSNYSNLSATSDYVREPQGYLLDVSNFVITVEDIVNKIRTLNDKTSAGPDKIPVVFLKACAESLAYPLYVIFNKTIQLSQFPKVWKQSYVVPIHKGNSKSDVKNYRGVSIISAIPKLFEAIICDKLQKITKNFIMEEQHGFCKGKSTSSNLYKFVNFVSTALEDGNEVDTIYTDLTKAFDRVNINILVSKLHAAGIRDPLLSWIASYLLEREQIVKVKGFFSQNIKVTSGVPQGSHLGPLLFNIYINDLKEFIDKTGWISKELDGFVAWCKINGLEINISKCKILRFSCKKMRMLFDYIIEGNKLEHVDVFCDLGVYFDRSLSYSQHVDDVVNKCNKRLGFITRITKEFSNTRPIIILYVSFIRSLLDYGSVIWTPNYKTAKKRLERLQMKIIKTLAFKSNIDYNNSDYVKLLEYFGIPAIERRHKYLDICFAFNLLNNHIDCPSILEQFYLHVPSYSIMQTIK